MSGSLDITRSRIDQLADDTGRLRRHLASIVDDYECSYTAALVDRIAGHVQALDLHHRDPAAIRYRQLADAGVDEEAALEQALAEADRAAAAMRRRLGLEERP